MVLNSWMLMCSGYHHLPDQSTCHRSSFAQDAAVGSGRPAVLRARAACWRLRWAESSPKVSAVS
eukprot:4733995-Alexandrium_andersonii.AAC.1